jgi:hypothetical protein
MKKMIRALNTWSGRLRPAGIVLAAAIGLLGMLPGQATDVSLMSSYQVGDGTLQGGCIWAPDTVSVPIIVLTDSDTPEGEHSISYDGGETVYFTVGAGGVITGGSTVETLSFSDVGPDVPIPDQIPPLDGASDYPPVGWVPAPIVNRTTFYLDYDSGSGTYYEADLFSYESDFEWNGWLFGPDSVFGYQDVYYAPPRAGLSTTQPIYFYLPGGVDQDPQGKKSLSVMLYMP